MPETSVTLRELLESTIRAQAERTQLQHDHLTLTVEQGFHEVNKRLDRDELERQERTRQADRWRETTDVRLDNLEASNAKFQGARGAVLFLVVVLLPLVAQIVLAAR